MKPFLAILATIGILNYVTTTGAQGSRASSYGGGCGCGG
jgi:hypothetical protein